MIVVCRNKESIRSKATHFKSMFIFSIPIRYFLESYLIMMVACFLNISGLSSETGGEVFSGILAVVVIGLYGVLTIGVFYFLLMKPLAYL